jgi:hypothetical protein
VSDLDFFADLVSTGTVLGIDHTSELAVVEEVLGYNSTFEVSGSAMISDFGLVEVGWHRGGPQGDWEVTYFGAQPHRLPWLGDRNEIGTALMDHYGGFRPRLDLDELRTALHLRGFTLEEIPSLNDGCAEYWEPTSRMGLIAVSDPGECNDEPAGTVLKMLGPDGSKAWRRFRGHEQAFTSYATHLLPLSEAERVAWLDKREPDADPERTDWWTYLRSTVARRTAGTPTAKAQWQQLGFALNHHAAERDIDTADEAAVALLVSLAHAHDLGLTDELPTMDEAVERWLTAIPTTLAHARRLCTDRPLDPSGIRLSRRLRNQIHDIQPYLPHVTSAALADELRAWIDLKPALLRLPVTGRNAP